MTKAEEWWLNRVQYALQEHTEEEKQELAKEAGKMLEEYAASRDSRELSAVPSELFGIMMSIRKVNTPEWLEYLIEEMNKVLEKLGDSDRVYYDAQRDIIRKRGIAG